MHVNGGGSFTWAELVKETGLSRGALRSRVKTYRNAAGIQTRQGEHLNTSKVEQNGQNAFRAEASFDFPATLDDLLKFHNVDTEIWEVERWGASAKQNDWEGYAKIGSSKVVNYNKDGAQVGYTTKEQLETIPMHGEACKIWATFRRKIPIPVFPIIEPVECNATYKKPPAPKRGEVARSLLICDPHIGYAKATDNALLTPFHDRGVMDIALQIAVAAQVDRIDILGDYLDLAEWSKFSGTPEFYFTTQPSVDEGHWWLRQYREAAPQARIAVFEGNHDKRVRQVLAKHAMAALELRAADEVDLPPALSLPKLLALHKLGVVWCGDYPDELEWLNENFALLHGTGHSNKAGGASASIVNRMRVKVAYAHEHRANMSSLTYHTANGPLWAMAFSPGCACHTDGRAPGSKKTTNWQKGIAIIQYEVGGDAVAIDHIPIEDGHHAIYNGQVFTARNRVKDLKRDIPRWNWGA